jgi:hypothetical protein
MTKQLALVLRRQGAETGLVALDDPAPRRREGLFA